MEDLALGADIALGVGLAGVAVGAVLILVDPPRGATADGAAVRVLPVVGASGGGLTVQGSF
jgi:hypothetical protein